MSKFSCSCGGPKINASLDLMLVLNRRYIGKEIDALAFI